MEIVPREDPFATLNVQCKVGGTKVHGTANLGGPCLCNWWGTGDSTWRQTATHFAFRLSNSNVASIHTNSEVPVNGWRLLQIFDDSFSSEHHSARVHESRLT